MTTATLCCHYYDIEPPNGIISMGVCRDCGESKDLQDRVDKALQEAKA